MIQIHRETDTNVEIPSYEIKKNIRVKLKILSYEEKLFLLNTIVEAFILFIICFISLLLESFLFNNFVTDNSFNSSLLLVINLITIVIFLLFISNYIYFKSKKFLYKNIVYNVRPSKKGDDSNE